MRPYQLFELQQSQHPHPPVSSLRRGPVFYASPSALIGDIGLRTVQANATVIHEHDLTSIKYLKDAHIQALYYARSLRDYIINTDVSKMNQIKASMDQYEALMKTDLDDYQQNRAERADTQLLKRFFQ